MPQKQNGCQELDERLIISSVNRSWASCPVWVGLTDLVIRLIVGACEMRICRREQEERDRRQKIETKQRLEREERLRLANADLQDRQSQELVKLNELLHQANNWKESQLLREYFTLFKSP